MSEKMNHLMQNRYNSGDSINANPVFTVWVILKAYKFTISEI